VIDVERSKLTVIVSTVTDLVLLLIMFVGLLNLRYEGRGALGLRSRRPTMETGAVVVASHVTPKSLTCPLS